MLEKIATQMIEVQKNNCPISREKLQLVIKYCLGQSDLDYYRLALIMEECLKEANNKQEMENSVGG